jgi:cation diffusion facilitator CzcD-associated flavoprotein CzcO
MVTELLPEGYDVATHFTPRYDPWRQRVAFVPDGDLFAGISAGLATMVTDQIDHLDERGVVLASGDRIDADVIITATGFNLSVLGGIDFSVDGVPLDLATTVTYRGAMFTGVPNMIWVFGYFRASWTLRADLLAAFVCRLLDHMDELGVHRVTPRLRPEDADMAVGPWIDPADFNPGYLQRSMHLMPRSGDKPEWRHSQDYWSERVLFPEADLDDGCLVYE